MSSTCPGMLPFARWDAGVHSAAHALHGMAALDARLSLGVLSLAP